MIITGNLFEIGVKNGNGWSIPESEVSNVLRTLTGIPLKKCPDGGEPHVCDYTWSDKGIIGNIQSAARDGKWIKASAEVTNTLAIQKIRSGEFPIGWSIFAGYLTKTPDGALTGLKPLAVTLCQHPAYPEAGYTAAGLEQVEYEYSGDMQLTAAAGRIERKYLPHDQKFSALENHYLSPDQPQTQKESPAEALASALWKLSHKCKGSSGR